ncbi:MAG TPA: alpha/beta fold hydrolase [Spirochaetota bacterium]|nr:alpha/beta fold hydrolase [Spirochaetota bacterium]HPC39421.1 alpha/beta fold hydrolase [Spirochaetota bacterium]HPL17305.1 alpha/beta fold hydrolase [Spirochaetota bacterium]HQF06758.1 alpha/beta fold hydrolase [Spirochaetota bacterium]HQH95623.1 alpha/beta fold hydrolase [Spirochaetota bacterium]
MSDYARFDHPAVSSFLFYPRPEESRSLAGDNIVELSIPVDNDVMVGGKIFTSSKSSPSILFFHGNGEIVIDYDDLGPLYVNLGLNFIPVDYRGYGRSGGSPSVSAMMRDCHTIFDYMKEWLKEEHYTGPFIIMGRSLGSASALELAATRQNEVNGLIIDSGFAYALPLLRIIGVDPDRLGIREEEGFLNIDKIRQFRKPTLIIHAERDHIIPYSDGCALFEASPAETKDLVTIKEANHNTIFMYGLREFLTAVRKLADALE